MSWLVCWLTAVGGSVFGGSVFGGSVFGERAIGLWVIGLWAAASGDSSWQRVLQLEDYNTRVVVLGTTLLGLAAGIVGSLTLLRRRALMGDALSHAALPGIGIAFLVSVAGGGTGKSLPVLLCGAALSGGVGVAVILVIRHWTRIKEDAALGIVLSVFFGAGVSILGLVAQMPAGHAAGLEAFIYGKTASMIASDAQLIAAASLLCLIVCGLFFKEFRLLCFDESYAASAGYPVLLLDGGIMFLVIVVTIIGLQAVGLVLIIALLVIPAAAAGFWTARMFWMAVWAAGLGALSGMVGSAVSAVYPRVPSGAMIVLVAAMFFSVSLVVGSRRGLLVRLRRRQGVYRRLHRRHLLRGIYEILEARGELIRDASQRLSGTVSFDDLLRLRSWSPRRLKRQIRSTVREGFCQGDSQHGLRLTHQGERLAARLVHEHRLWELYLIQHADVAPSKVDRDADTIEHVLDAELISEVEATLSEHGLSGPLVPSPHPILQRPGNGAT